MNILRFLFLVFTSLILTACGQSQTSSGDGTDMVDQVAEGSDIKHRLAQSMRHIEPTRYHEFIDPKNGIAQARYPIPKSWKVHSPDAPVYIEGPGQMNIYKSVTENYAWSQNPMMQQTLQMNGQRVAQPMSAQQVLRNWIQPNAKRQGYRLLDSYPLPEIAGYWQKLFHAMPQTGSNRQVEALGTEWDTGKGSKSFIVLVRHQTAQQQTVLWTIQTTELEASPDAFSQARDAYIYSIANAQFNPQWIQHMNGLLIGNIQKTNAFWARATAESTAAHQQRMQAISDRGNAALAQGKTYSDILDISHQGYLSRSSIQDAGHERSIRAINETTLIGNHETGEHYTVPSGANYYWVSEDGYYFGTDNALFDPNTVSQMKDKSWTKFAHE